MTTLDITNNWKLVDTDNISGRLNVMWLSSDGIGILTREYSHMTILNMILEKSSISSEINKSVLSIPLHIIAKCIFFVL